MSYLAILGPEESQMFLLERPQQLVAFRPLALELDSLADVLLNHNRPLHFLQVSNQMLRTGILVALGFIVMTFFDKD